MSNIKLNVKFIIERRRITFFAKFLCLGRQKDIFKQAIANLNYIKHNWIINRDFCEKIINSAFSGYFFKKDVKVSIFPTNFYLGAAETKKHLILFGQPIRCQDFSSALILHEVAHIFLSKIKTKRGPIVDEIICLLLEEIIYAKKNKHIEDVWKKEELDIFHLKAFEYAVRYRDKITYDKLQVDYLINLFKTKLPKKILKIVPPVGLLKNIKNKNG